MKWYKYLLFAFAALASFEVSAQNIETYKGYLAAPVQVDSLTRVDATVRVVEHNLSLPTESQKVAAVNGYRIMIFMSNTQSARTDAVAARDLFTELFAEERSYITYENPYFKVTVGNCTTQEEALILLERIKRSFPKAFLVRETIALSELSL